MFYYACTALFTAFMYIYIQIQHTPFMPKGQYSAVLKYGGMTVTAVKIRVFFRVCAAYDRESPAALHACALVLIAERRGIFGNVLIGNVYFTGISKKHLIYFDNVLL